MSIIWYPGVITHLILAIVPLAMTGGTDPHHTFQSKELRRTIDSYRTFPNGKFMAMKSIYYRTVRYIDCYS
jgi:hypothetical protein